MRSVSPGACSADPCERRTARALGAGHDRGTGSRTRE
jgi:hypothetical protein